VTIQRRGAGPAAAAAPPADLPATLGHAYVEMVRRFRAGDEAEALAIRDTIEAQLGGAITRTYQAALAALDAGPPHAALSGFAEALELHRLNIANLAMPVDVAACYDGLRRYYLTQDQALGAAAAARLAARRGASVYAQPRACQLPVLGGLYELLFGQRTDGTFVEVGAFDGETYSNTSCLADRGWRGLYIEPVPAACTRCRERHAGNPTVQVVECAIGAADGSAALWQNGPCSTLSEAEHAFNLERGLVLEPEITRIDVPVRRLDDVLIEAGIAPRFDLLVVDVDGTEEAVFAGFTMARWRPRYLLVELIEDSGQFAGHAGLIGAARRVREHIADVGYREIYRDPSNTLFRAPD
jgi:FkbM family methyltransferase